MDIFEVMKARHAVRSYNDNKIEEATVKQLRDLIEECNRESGLHIQLCTEEPNAFNSMLAHYGKFRNVKNYVALIGKKSKGMEEKIGYYGEKIVLKATEHGLGSCWVAMSYSKGKCGAIIDEGEKLVCVIALGYSDEGTAERKTKSVEELSRVSGTMPEWFYRGMEAAQLAPTAMNQQKFRFVLNGNAVSATPGVAFYARVDLGIAKCHFELGAGKDNFKWA